ncbi:hypothetical protein L581_2839 [Serratia fonticola AU-AP2C]|nr:hypothetical protein L581_2839 [Serratia fonticola AU-AP2C]
MKKVIFIGAQGKMGQAALTGLQKHQVIMQSVLAQDSSAG